MKLGAGGSTEAGGDQEGTGEGAARRARPLHCSSSLLFVFLEREGMD